jgi:hypothetical protein
MTKVPLIEDDDAIKALSPDRSDHSTNLSCQGDRAEIGRFRAPVRRRTKALSAWPLNTAKHCGSPCD